MRSLAKLSKLLPLLFILLFACDPGDEPITDFDADGQEFENFIADGEYRYLDPSAKIAAEVEPCGDPLEISLLYFRHVEVGKVTFWNTESALYIDYDIMPDIALERTMLVVVFESKGKINPKKIFTKDKYKKLIYSINHDPGTADFLYEIPFSEFGTDVKCVSVIAMAKVRYEDRDRYRRSMYAFGRIQTNSKRKGFNEFLVEYCMQDCSKGTDTEADPCEVTCTSGFGIPSVDVEKSFSFVELNITDWSWGYVHEIKNETLFRLPIRYDDSESATVVGQVTVMIEAGQAYVYFQMYDGTPMIKSRMYIGPEPPLSGVPCEYNYGRDYADAEGNWAPVNTDTYMVDNLDALRDANGKFYIVTYVEFCP